MITLISTIKMIIITKLKRYLNKIMRYKRLKRVMRVNILSLVVVIIVQGLILKKVLIDDKFI